MRPNLGDPKEWAIVRDMYFGGMNRPYDDMDPLEKWDRMQHKRTENQGK